MYPIKRNKSRFYGIFSLIIPFFKTIISKSFLIKVTWCVNNFNDLHFAKYNVGFEVMSIFMVFYTSITLKYNQIFKNILDWSQFEFILELWEYHLHVSILVDPYQGLDMKWGVFNWFGFSWIFWKVGRSIWTFFFSGTLWYIWQSQ